MKLFNPGLCSIWRLDPDFLRGEPHVREVLPVIRDLFSVSDREWPAFAQRLVARTTDPDARSGRYERPDGPAIDSATVPLPDGRDLLSYCDVPGPSRATELWGQTWS